MFALRRKALFHLLVFVLLARVHKASMQLSGMVEISKDLHATYKSQIVDISK